MLSGSFCFSNFLILLGWQSSALGVKVFKGKGVNYSFTYEHVGLDILGHESNIKIFCNLKHL